MSGQGNNSYIHLELIFDRKSLPGNFLAQGSLDLKPTFEP